MTGIFFLKQFSFLLTVLLLSCSVKDEPLIGFAVYPGDAESSINSKIIEKNISRGNFIYACSEKASLSELVSSLSDAGCAKIIIRGEALVISGYFPAENTVIIDPPDDKSGFLFDAEFALKRADDFRKKKFCQLSPASSGCNCLPVFSVPCQCEPKNNPRNESCFTKSTGSAYRDSALFHQL